MTSLDWLSVAIYFALMLGLSVWLGRRQQSLEDYYLGGNRLPWWSVGISILATQSSAISFVSVPAFVAIAPGGGLRWLHYELALPLAMLVLGVTLLPALRGGGFTTIYEFLEQRWDWRVRRAVGCIFLLSRGLATGVAVYATAIVMEVSLGLPLAATILLIGGITVLYDLFGGMAAVVVSDVIQAVVLVLGLMLVIWFAAAGAGIDIGSAWQSLDAPRRATLAAAGGTGELAAFLVGGVFLYVSYYGCDQSQAQRLLATRSVADARKALALNGFLRFPLTMGYVSLGLVAAGLLASSPQFASQIADSRPDYLVPALVLEVVPPGLRGIIYAALLAAAMSSLDSAINALSATTVQDFLRRPGEELAPRRALFLGRATTLGWGALVTVFAFFVGDIAPTVIESINRIGSAFFGPVLAVFALALLPRRAPSWYVVAALLAGVMVNVVLWRGVPSLHWMWWNVVGFAVTSITGLLPVVRDMSSRPGNSMEAGAVPAWYPWSLVVWFVLALAVTAALGSA